MQTFFLKIFYKTRLNLILLRIYLKTKNDSAAEENKLIVCKDEIKNLHLLPNHRNENLKDIQNFILFLESNLFSKKTRISLFELELLIIFLFSINSSFYYKSFLVLKNIHLEKMLKLEKLSFHKYKAEVFKQYKQDDLSKAEAIQALLIADESGLEDESVSINANYLKSNFSNHSTESAMISSHATDSFETEINQQKRKFDSLFQLSNASMNILDPDEQSQIILKESIRLLGAERGLLFLKNSFDSQLHLQQFFSSDGSKMISSTDYYQSVIEKVQKYNKPVIFNTDDKSDINASEKRTSNSPRSIIASPIINRDNLSGILYLDSSLSKGVFSRSDVQVLFALCQYISIALESAKIGKMKLENVALEKDLELAGAVQNLLIPQPLSTHLSDFSVSGFFKAASQSGGDWLWYDVLENGNLRIILGDVTGHGPGSAMITSSIAGAYKSLTQTEKNQTTPFQLLALFDDVIKKISKGKYWMTMSIFELSSSEKKVNVYNAAAPAGILINNDQVIDLETGPSTPLGSENFQISNLSFPLSENFKILIFTDGIYEFTTTKGTQFGTRRLTKLFQNTINKYSFSEIQFQLASEILNLQKGKSLEDDITFVCISAYQN